MKLGFNGDIAHKNKIIQRMSYHIAQDALAMGFGYMGEVYGATGYRSVGCAVTCLAFDKLSRVSSVLGSQSSYDYTYTKLEKLLGIPNLPPLIDALHEMTDEDFQFSLKLLEVLAPDKDYENLVELFMKEVAPDRTMEKPLRDGFETLMFMEASLCKKYPGARALHSTAPANDFIQFVVNYGGLNNG